MTSECAPIAGSNKLPVTGISKAQADAYAAWLSRISGARYRLPTDNEWEFAARAKDRSATGTMNCLIRSNGQIIKGGAPDLVSSGPQNSWGLVNYVGNVQEWTLDGGTLRARGGYFGDDAASCDISLLRAHSGAPDKATGFRLVRDIKG
jgi:formylglycine-generating enzyme required for sulfatase activity